MKTCKKCGEEKEEEQFPWSNEDKGWKKGHCRVCHNAYYRLYYSDLIRKQKHHKRVEKVQKEQITKVRKMVMEYLEKHPCVDCGETNPLVLEFDHRDSSKKDFIVSSALSSHGYVRKDSVQGEIDKCDIRCAN